MITIRRGYLRPRHTFPRTTGPLSPYEVEQLHIETVADEPALLAFRANQPQPVQEILQPWYGDKYPPEYEAIGDCRLLYRTN